MTVIKPTAAGDDSPTARKPSAALLLDVEVAALAPELDPLRLEMILAAWPPTAVVEKGISHSIK